MASVDPLEFERTMGPGEASGAGAEALRPGTRLDRYEVIKLLGRGGMGEVYEVEHVGLRERYALKLLPSMFGTQPDAVARFEREARVTVKLRHRGIIGVGDSGCTDGRYWLRMELAPGVDAEGHTCRSLADVVAAAGGTLEQWLAHSVFGQILEGLAHAHRQGVVHRDLKPTNILVTGVDEEGFPVVKIADFGLVKLVGEQWLQNQADVSMRMSVSVGNMATMQPGGDAEAAGGASTQALIGTYAYMSPEQKQGQPADARSDVYAVGLMMFRMLTGRTELRRRGPSELVDGVFEAWDELVYRSLEEFPEDRYADGREMLEAFRAAAFEDGAAQAAAAWHMAENGTPSPAMTLEDLASAIAAGRVTAATSVWSEGMAGWTPAGEVEALRKYLGRRGAVPPVHAAEPSTPSRPGPADGPEFFDVILMSAGERNIAVMKEFREITGFSLASTKRLVESVPVAVKEGVDAAEAAAIGEKLERVGGSVPRNCHEKQDLRRDDSATRSAGLF